MSIEDWGTIRSASLISVGLISRLPYYWPRDTVD